MTNTDVLLNNFATRSFRDMADRDYVHARLAFRHHLIPQFQWSALHCLEKYVKAILLYNRIPGKKIKHEISAGLMLIESEAKFSITLPSECVKYVKRLESGARFRYYEVSYASRSDDLILLDKTVSHVRRYCQVLDYALPHGTQKVPMLPLMLERIAKAEQGNFIDTCVTGGWLERTMSKKEHPARDALLWKNLYFGARARRTITMNTYSESGNAPLFLNPEILDEVLKYVFLPGEVQNGWREEIERRKAKSGKG